MSQNKITKIKNNFISFDSIFLRKNEEFSIFMDPTYYLMLVENNDNRIKDKKFDEELLYLFCLQDKIQYITEYFLNSYHLLNTEGQPSYDQLPLGIILPKNLQFLSSVIYRRNGVELKSFNKTLESANFTKGTIPSKTVARLIAAFYNDFENILTLIPRGQKYNIDNTITFDPDKYVKNNSVIGPVIKELSIYVKEKILQFITTFHLHGSLATEDYVLGCSDCDTFATLTKETVSSENALMSLRDKINSLWSFFYKIDRFQHHGVFFTNEFETQFYPQSYFPLKLFDYSLCMFAKNDYTTFYERDSSLERKNTLWNILYFFRHRLITEQYPKDVYSLKEFLQVLLLSPTIFLQLNGDYLYKKFSFEKIRSYFNDPKNLSLLDMASEYRKNDTYSKLIDVNIPISNTEISANTSITHLNELRKSMRIPLSKTQISQMFNDDILYAGFEFAEKLLDMSFYQKQS